MPPKISLTKDEDEISLTNPLASNYIDSYKYNIINYNPQENLNYMIYDISNYLIYDVSNNIYNSCYETQSTIIYDISNNTYYIHDNPFTINTCVITNYILNCLIHAPMINSVKGNYLYVYLTDLKCKYNDALIVKIGFSAEITDRGIGLCSKLKCKLLLLGHMTIGGIHEETQLHKYLQFTYNLLYYPIYCPKNKNKILSKETYIFHPIIMNNLVKYNFNLNSNFLLQLEQEKTKQIIAIETTKQVIAIETTKQEQEKTEQLRLQLQILQLQLQINK